MYGLERKSSLSRSFGSIIQNSIEKRNEGRSKREVNRKSGLGTRNQQSYGGRLRELSKKVCHSEVIEKL